MVCQQQLPDPAERKYESHEAENAKKSKDISIMKRKTFLGLVSLAMGLCGLESAIAQTTAFTYQGKLVDDCCPATGLYDLTFTLYDNPGPGLTGQKGPIVALAHVPVTNGLFTVSLDFGSSAFP